MTESTHPHRRDVMNLLAGLTFAGAVQQNLMAAETRSGDMIFRTLGRTGERVSAVGLGGAHLGRLADQAEATRVIRTSIDRGINFMDNAWAYADGKCETWMGEALRDGYRNKVILMTKFQGRTKEKALEHINTSLQRLQTDRIDLIQLHETIRIDDPDRFFAEGGAVEAVMEAKKAGKVRYIGFTGHKDPLIHLRMLEVAAQNNFQFDTAQMPLNVLDYHFRSFAHQVVPQLVKQNMGVIGMKPMASGTIPKGGFATGMECLHYALNLPTSVVLSGCDSMERLEQLLEAAKTFKPLKPAQISAIVSKGKEAAMTGKYELFKTSDRFDGSAKRPANLG